MKMINIVQKLIFGRQHNNTNQSINYRPQRNKITLPGSLLIECAYAIVILSLITTLLNQYCQQLRYYYYQYIMPAKCHMHSSRIINHLFAYYNRHQYFPPPTLNPQNQHINNLYEGSQGSIGYLPLQEIDGNKFDNVAPCNKQQLLYIITNNNIIHTNNELSDSDDGPITEEVIDQQMNQIAIILKINNVIIDNADFVIVHCDPRNITVEQNEDIIYDIAKYNIKHNRLSEAPIICINIKNCHCYWPINKNDPNIHYSKLLLHQ